ncbi:helix-turn-helix transcriptional regulator [Paenibacillus cremeus]|uniref:MarR family transcriptional regulator n=1 Tax=Paenibacillus cremeus TaxID=2163881 RepID=A0A559KFW0_9BACL|nr:methanogen output domain 1-containing protein [Paenibacillus cremeus]TVY11012.1 MarR family transcriptional regulator [Paenibacillus cremeus]
MSFRIDHIPEPRRTIVQTLKTRGSSSMGKLAAVLEISAEAVRQHLKQLELEGWISRSSIRSSGVGRPEIQYRLTAAGEHLFDKKYDQLTVELLDVIGHQLGETALQQVLQAMIEARVASWRPRLEGLSKSDRLNALKHFYSQEDAFMEVEQEDDTFYFIERNCPFHNVAIQRPALCNVTISVLTQLLNCKVTREQSFQNGDGCCRFRLADPKEMKG